MTTQEEKKVYKRTLKDVFPLDMIQRKTTKRQPSKGRMLYYIYVLLTHNNYPWLVRESLHTIVVRNEFCRRTLKLNNYTWGEWMQQGETVGLWKVLEKERGITKLHFPLIKNMFEANKFLTPKVEKRPKEDTE